MSEYHLDADMADRIIDQAAAFLAACATTAAPLSPSLAVDIGWHAMVLHTRDYAEFCQRVAGRFIHHVPHDDDGGDGGDVQTVLDRSAAAISAAGYRVDRQLWRVEGAQKCSQCHNGCSNDPPPNPK
ncbi:hypothetical protein AB0I28_19785 [Phytomonospora sp. NPDC050363]|uniref:glycine-rich domain-containing protein n=1 Tax=Phytomonospora sp. NPDC050363 TaxID=3155642 RepID=UPI0033FC70A6